MRSMFGRPHVHSFDAESREGGLWVAVSVVRHPPRVPGLRFLRALRVALYALALRVHIDNTARSQRNFNVAELAFRCILLPPLPFFLITSD